MRLIGSIVPYFGCELRHKNGIPRDGWFGWRFRCIGVTDYTTSSLSSYLGFVPSILGASCVELHGSETIDIFALELI